MAEVVQVSAMGEGTLGHSTLLEKQKIPFAIYGNARGFVNPFWRNLWLRFSRRSSKSKAYWFVERITLRSFV